LNEASGRRQEIESPYPASEMDVSEHACFSPGPRTAENDPRQGQGASDVGGQDHHLGKEK